MHNQTCQLFYWPFFHVNSIDVIIVYIIII